MQSFNFINFIHIVDLSLLNFIDYSDVIDNSYQINEQGQLYLNLNANTRKVLAGFIINNINDNIQYGKQNIIINTCKPMQNWRQIQRNKAVRSYKYKFIDESVCVDEIKLNQYLDTIYFKLPSLNLNKISENYIGFNDISKFTFQNNVKCLQFDTLDIWDTYSILKNLLSNVGSLTFDSLNYNIIIDGNYVYVHNSSFPDEIKDNVRLELLGKGIL